MAIQEIMAEMELQVYLAKEVILEHPEGMDYQGRMELLVLLGLMEEMADQENQGEMVKLEHLEQMGSLEHQVLVEHPVHQVRMQNQGYKERKVHLVKMD